MSALMKSNEKLVWKNLNSLKSTQVQKYVMLCYFLLFLAHGMIHVLSTSNVLLSSFIRSKTEDSTSAGFTLFSQAAAKWLGFKQILHLFPRAKQFTWKGKFLLPDFLHSKFLFGWQDLLHSFSYAFFNTLANSCLTHSCSWYCLTMQSLTLLAKEYRAFLWLVISCKSELKFSFTDF